MDHLAGSTDHLHCNLHEMLGKMLSTSLTTTEQGTPIAAPKIAEVFKTPDVILDGQDETKEDSNALNLSLGQRLGLDKVLGRSEDNKKPKERTGTVGGTGLPRFQASLAWASDSSPILVNSAERCGRSRVETYGCLLYTSPSPRDS